MRQHDELGLMSVPDSDSLIYAPCEHGRSITEYQVEGNLCAQYQVAADTFCSATVEDEDEAAEKADSSADSVCTYVSW